MLEIQTDSFSRIQYSTDASAYREAPYGVAFPRTAEEIVELIKFARENQLSIIPRGAGTSLAGQVVGSGLVVDVSRYMNKILEINPQEKWVRVQPGVVLDELNLFCKPYGLFFGPETSTSNRCCIGGMVGNNSCGSHSLVYGSTRDHLLEAQVVLSDGSRVEFRGLSKEEVNTKLGTISSNGSFSGVSGTSVVENGNENLSLETRIYRQIVSLLSDKENQKEIAEHFPDRALRRRNSGYALDELLYSDYFQSNPEGFSRFNLCKILAGSEGTLAFATEFKLNLVPLPPAQKAVICVHCSTLEEVFEANLVVLNHCPVAVELMDNTILELSKQNIEQSKNRFFVKGDPAAILIVELAEETREAVDQKAEQMEADLRTHGYGYHYPRIYNKEIACVWNLRKAGLGLLSGMPGNAKPVSVIEDTAVAPYRLPAYMADIRKMLDKHKLSCVYHAHISTGELHLRPILNLKEPDDRKLFRAVAEETAGIVKKHKGSLSGEHGDGRLRGEFIPLLFGDRVYGFLKEIKTAWDPDGLFNPGKIVDTPPMDQNLRYETAALDIATYFNYDRQKGWLCAIEQCNGSGDCRKSSLSGGTMCPSFRAANSEGNTTRARANTLRELLIHPRRKEIFNQKEILQALDTCVSCKACKRECPSNVDMARFKAEYLQHHYDETRVPLRSFLIANITRIQKLGMIFPALYNAFVSWNPTAFLLKRTIRFAPQRTIPRLYKYSLKKWAARQDFLTGKSNSRLSFGSKGKVYLFADEFTNYMEVEVGQKFIGLLVKLGYEVLIPEHLESGRTEISKGLLTKARELADKNVALLKDVITDEIPLVGIEPSCILSFRDEYPDLVHPEWREAAASLAPRCLLFDEFIVREIKKGNITGDRFTDRSLHIVLHGHCHQKSLASVEPSKEMLQLPSNYTVEIIPSGCCGMAGSFGYEKEHYELSMQIGGDVLFPAVKKAALETCIAAPGTSCRQQIKDGTGRVAKHPVEILYDALNG